MRRSYWIAGTIAVLAAGWLASGMLFKSGEPASSVPAEAAQIPDPKPADSVDVSAAEPIDVPEQAPQTRPGEIVSVQVATSKAEPQPRTIVLRGRTEADRVVEVRAETTGRVVEIPVEEGALVHKGDLIAVLDGSDRAARLAEAKALLLQRKAEAEASKRLADKDRKSTRLNSSHSQISYA